MRTLNEQQSEAKARQSAKLAEIRNALIELGFDTTAKQATALGVGRSTAWALLNGGKRAGPKPIILKRILVSPNLPPPLRQKVEEYVADKIAGLYGHGKGVIVPLQSVSHRDSVNQRGDQNRTCPTGR